MKSPPSEDAKLMAAATIAAAVIRTNGETGAKAAADLLWDCYIEAFGDHGSAPAQLETAKKRRRPG